MDLRQRNTYDQIIKGLITCMKEKPFRELTNADIISAYGISPRTFYRYFSDKNALLNDLEKELIGELKAALREDRQSLTNLDHDPTTEEIFTLADPAFKNTMAYARRNKDIGQALLSKNGDILFAREIEEISEKEFKIRAKYLSGNKNLDIKDSLFIKIYVSQIIMLIESWLFYSDQISA